MSLFSALIIDDDIWMQRILSKTLQGYGFKKIYLSSNGFDGIASAVENVPDLIVLDILMPDLSGHQTLKVLKTIKDTKEIPVLIVSALSDVENLGLAVKSGTAGFISKPFTRATVFEKLLDIFGREKLEFISKGEGFSPEELYISDSEYASARQDVREMIDVPRAPAETAPAEEEKQAPAPVIAAKQENVLKKYPEDEKRSIESIKKLLLKSRGTKES